MARALSLAVRRIPPDAVGDYFSELRRRKDYFRAASCNFWAFEDPEDPGSYTEFTEAPDRQTLAAAHRGAGEELETAPILTEVELI